MAERRRRGDLIETFECSYWIRRHWLDLHTFVRHYKAALHNEMRRIKDRFDDKEIGLPTDERTRWKPVSHLTVDADTKSVIYNAVCKPVNKSRLTRRRLYAVCWDSTWTSMQDAQHRNVQHVQRRHSSAPCTKISLQTRASQRRWYRLRMLACIYTYIGIQFDILVDCKIRTGCLWKQTVTEVQNPIGFVRREISWRVKKWLDWSDSFCYRIINLYSNTVIGTLAVDE